MLVFRALLLFGLALVLLWILAGCALRLGGATTRQDVTAAFDGENEILYAAGRGLKRLDLKTGVIHPLLSVDRPFLRVLRDGDGRLVFEARDTTPKGRPTIQLFVESSGKLVRLLTPDESMRSGLAILHGRPAYVRQTEWRGAFGGTPWSGEGALCQIVGGHERIVATALRRTASTHGATGVGNLLPYSYYAETGHGPYAVAIVDLANGATRELGRFGSIYHPCLSPDGKRVAFWSWDDPKAIVELDASSGREMARHPVEGRLVGVMFSPAGDLYVLAGEAGAGFAELRRLNGDRFEKIAVLR